MTETVNKIISIEKLASKLGLRNADIEAWGVEIDSTGSYVTIESVLDKWLSAGYEDTKILPVGNPSLEGRPRAVVVSAWTPPMDVVNELIEQLPTQLQRQYRTAFSGISSVSSRGI
ncbi:MAG: hypothetical protein SFX19_03295 [Alphaproteobacteria bacterium]|nr:hypothetical protein [Alphaproteobacteria bacterium]